VYRYRHFIKTGVAILVLAVAALAFFFARNYYNKPDNGGVAVSGLETDTPAKIPSAQGVNDSGDNAEVKKPRQEIMDLRKEYGNDDIIGRLLIEDTTIDYPVTRYKDNEFYLTRDIYKETSAAGWIYMDYENHVYTLDRNTIIYGHNMKKDMMFHDLRLYRDEKFFSGHRYIIFDTLYEETVWEIFSFMKAPVELNYLQVSPSDTEFGLLLYNIKALSMYDTGVPVTNQDKILNLSTCSVNPDEAMYRYVLSAKLISVSE